MDSLDAFDRLREVFRRPEGSAGEPPAVHVASDGEPGGLDPGIPGLRVLVLAGVLAAVLAGLYLWWSRPEPEAAPRAVLSPATAAARPVAAAAPSRSSSAVVVDVAGKVRHPGVVGLPAGARVIDAIKAAGGLRHGASAGTLNLARRVVDGEQIPVGIDLTPSPVTQPGPSGAATGGPIDLNTASVSQLDQLPGVGPVLAQRIADYRGRRGAFRSVEELRQVSGIGEAKFTDIKDLVRV